MLFEILGYIAAAAGLFFCGYIIGVVHAGSLVARACIAAGIDPAIVAHALDIVKRK